MKPWPGVKLQKVANFENVLIQRIIYIVMSLILGIASSGVMVNQHYCQNELKSSSLFFEAKPCYEKKTVSCPMHGEMTLPGDHKKDCCDNRESFVKSSTDQIIIHAVVIPDLIELFVLPLKGLMDYRDAEITGKKYLNLKPPLLTCDLRVRLQSFLC